MNQLLLWQRWPQVSSEGVSGVAAMSQVIGGGVPLIYFSRKNKSLLRLTKTEPDKHSLVRVCINGSSDL